MPTPLAVAVAEDHVVFRRQLVVALERDPDVVVVAEAPDLDRLAGRLSARPAVIVADASPPVADGGRALSRTTATGAPPVLVLLGPGDDPVLALASGAVGAVAKGALLAHGPRLVRLAAAGIPLVDASTARGLLAAADGLDLRLAPPQLEVLHRLTAAEAPDELARWPDRERADARDQVRAAIMDLLAAARPGPGRAPAPQGPDGCPPSRQ